jgi:hypothetical protein
MLILKADRLGTTARVPVSYPVLFQTDWYLDEGEVLDLSLPGCAIESSRCLIPDEYVRLQVLLPHHPVRVEVAKVRWGGRQSVRPGISEDASGRQGSALGIGDGLLCVRVGTRPNSDCPRTDTPGHGLRFSHPSAQLPCGSSSSFAASSF